MRSNSLLPAGIVWYTRVFSCYIQRICRLYFLTPENSEYTIPIILSLFPNELSFVGFRIKFLIKISPKSKLHGCLLGFKTDKWFISPDSIGKIQNIMFSSLSIFCAKKRRQRQKGREFSCWIFMYCICFIKFRCHPNPNLAWVVHNIVINKNSRWKKREFNYLL